MKVKPWLLCVIFFAAGCAALELKKTDVVFDDPVIRLGIVPVEPTEKEKAGVELRVLPPAEGILKSREENVLYAMIQGQQGMRMKFDMDRTDRFGAGRRPGAYRLISETILEGQKGNLLEEKEMSERGEILEFIRGFHHSKIGNFNILHWTRAPIYPAGPVKIGEQWTYEETMDLQMDSPWVREVDPEPYKIQSASRLDGFAWIKNTRCAVIKTRAVSTRHEHLKMFFKNVIYDIRSWVDETEYLNYEKGMVLARITQTRSQTSGVNVSLEDTGQSQSIYYILP